MAKVNSHPRSRHGRRSSSSRQVSREYERGHSAPFSPETPEVSDSGSPAVEEAAGRDTQDGLTARRREERSNAKKRRGKSRVRLERTLH